LKAVCDTIIALGHATNPDQNGSGPTAMYIGAIATSDKGERVLASVAQ
jgi:hypothetical protein